MGTASPKLVIVDMQVSNLRSVVNAFKCVGVEPIITDDIQEIQSADCLILPGVGAFKPAMDALNEKGLVDVLRERVLEHKVPIIGICLGMQLLAETSMEYGQHDGLGLIKGRVEKLIPKEPEFRIPNIGWCDTIATKSSVLYPDVDVVEQYYYVHSYHMVCDNPEDRAAIIRYNEMDITVSVEAGNVYGTQFHPEKSQEAGLDLLSRFVQHVKDTV